MRKETSAARKSTVISIDEERNALCYNPRTNPLDMTETSTPLMRQYAAIKKSIPCSAFLPVGDFYELSSMTRWSPRANCKSP
jgi:hypothetical protein